MEIEAGLDAMESGARQRRHLARSEARLARQAARPMDTLIQSRRSRKLVTLLDLSVSSLAQGPG